jgi:hypothetical protein
MFTWVKQIAALSSRIAASYPRAFMNEAHQEARLQVSGGPRAPARIVLVALAATATVCVFFAVDRLRTAPETFTAILAIAVLVVVLDLVWKRIRPEQPAEASPVQSS